VSWYVQPGTSERLRDSVLTMIMGQGVSGGGPYALACAFALPSEKLKCVSIVCGLGPVFEIGMKGARWLNWIGFTFGYRYTPRILNRWFWQSQTCGRLDWSDEKRLERHMKDFLKSKSTAHEKDLEVMTDEDNAQRFLRSARESFAQGFDAALQDGRVLSMDFGFRIQDIRSDLPVQLWYGKHDVIVPLNHGETIAKRLSDRANLRVEDETHASIFFNWREQILEDLVKSI
jgi:pimeloyl-ACP methyl ester carboxylesterase